MESSRRGRAEWIVVAVLLLGVGLSVTVGITVAEHKRDTRVDWLKERAEVVAAETADVVDDAISGLDAIASFLETYPAATQEDFSHFVAGLDPSLSLIGVAYLSIVPNSELDEFVDGMRQTVPGYDVTEISDQGDVMPADRDRAVYFPVKFFHFGSVLDSALAGESESPLALGLGVDGASQAPWRPGLEIAASEATPTVSDFLEVGFGETFVGNAFVVAVPVLDDEGAVVGLVAAPMVDVLLKPELDLRIATEVEWHIDSLDTAHYIEDSHLAPIDLPGVTWYAHITPTPVGELELSGLPWWTGPAVGLMITIMAAVLARLLVARSRSRRRLEELAKVSAEKDRFLATVSHEIRTPLTAVTAVANELRDRPADFSPEEAASLLELMVEQSDEVTAIVEDLLIAGRPAVDSIIVSLIETDLIVEVRRAAQTVGVDIDIEGESITVVTDPKRVRQITRNLVTNALRYGGPEIRLWVGERGGQAAVEVRDDGKPIPAENRQPIFEPYTSTHKKSVSVGAMGLGLYISRTIAELLGGTLTYDHDGAHSVFTLALPLPAEWSEIPANLTSTSSPPAT